MIDINELDKISYLNKVVDMYERLNVELCQDILSRIKEFGELNSFTRSQLKVLARRGGIKVFTEAIKKTNKLSSKRKKELLYVFSQVINSDLESYRDLYEYRNLEMTLSTDQKKILAKMIKITDKELENMTKTIAFSSQKEFVRLVDKMYQLVVTNGMDFHTAFRKTTNELASKGVTLPMSNGKNRSIEAAVRQNVLYGIRQTAQGIENDLIGYLGADAVQINITGNCRHTHRVINGKIFCLDEKCKKYPYFKKDYQDLMQDYGCQHYTSPFIIGVSEPIYTSKEIEKANNRKVTYKGEQIDYYDATQKQRALERAVRNAKKQYLIAPDSENKANLVKSQKRVREFVKDTGLTRDYSREYFAGYNK